MKNSKKARTNLLLAVLVGLLIIAYKMLFSTPVDMSMDENAAASARVQATLIQVQAINFDVSALNEPKINSLQSIEIDLPNIPVGKKNPFAN